LQNHAPLARKKGDFDMAMRILIVGAGAVGGYFGDDADAEAMVAAVFCGAQVAPANNHTTFNRSKKGKNHD